MKILRLWKNFLGVIQKQTKFYLKRARLYLKKERLIAISLLSRVVGLILILFIAPSGVIKVSASDVIIESSQAYSYSIQFDAQKLSPISTPVVKTPEIILGESNFDRAEREERERQVAEKASKASKKANSRDIFARESRNYPIDPSLADKRALAKHAANKYGIDWKILEAVWQVESGKAWSTSTRSSAGAQGPMQFMRGTWNRYAVDGNGDGSADINFAEDAVYAGANLLAQAGASSGDIDSALYSYNHAQWYVNKVKAVANSIQE